ncbi:MAG: ArsR/SmtB family transcription factor [Anaerolineae bacterium]
MYAELVLRAAPLELDRAESLAGLFRALADPTRVRIISLLIGSEVGVSEIASQLEMSLSAISHQLNLLRLLHIVTSRRDGHQVIYRLDDEHVEMVYQQGVDHISHFQETR